MALKEHSPGSQPRSADQVVEIIHSRWDDCGRFFFGERTNSDDIRAIVPWVNFLEGLKISLGDKVACCSAPLLLQDAMAGFYGADVLSIEVDGALVGGQWDILERLREGYGEGNMGQVLTLPYEFTQFFNPHENIHDFLDLGGLSQFVEGFRKGELAAVMLPKVLDDPRGSEENQLEVVKTAVRLLKDGGRLLVSSEGSMDGFSNHIPLERIKEVEEASGVRIKPVSKTVLTQVTDARIFEVCK